MINQYCSCFNSSASNEIKILVERPMEAIVLHNRMFLENDPINFEATDN